MSEMANVRERSAPEFMTWFFPHPIPHPSTKFGGNICLRTNILEERDENLTYLAEVIILIMVGTVIIMIPTGGNTIQLHWYQHKRV